MIPGSLHDFFSEYFSAERGAAGKCWMMMLDDEVSSFGVYGYKDGRVYIRDARKGTKKYLSDKANADLDDPGFQCFGGALQPSLSFTSLLITIYFSHQSFISYSLVTSFLFSYHYQ